MSLTQRAALACCDKRSPYKMKTIGLSLLSALASYLVLLVVAPPSDQNGWRAVGFIFLGAITVLVWLLFLCPCLLIPGRSRFWRWFLAPLLPLVISPLLLTRVNWLSLDTNATDSNPYGRGLWIMSVGMFICMCLFHALTSREK